MILYPAIDLKDGNAVRLYKGEMDQATVFNDNPAAQALEFVNAGCEWLHLVDLNGAFAGEPVNAAPVEEILKQCKVPAQLGGGIRDMATIERWLDKGLERVILGTVAVENPDARSSKGIPWPRGRGHRCAQWHGRDQRLGQRDHHQRDGFGKIVRGRRRRRDHLYRHQP